MNNNMSAKGGSASGGKKILLTIALTVMGAMVLVSPAMAATSVSFSPVNVSVTSGKTFNVVIAINPQGIAIYTEKIALTYPADILEVRSFNFGGSWMPLAQSGYDLIDNTNGVLIKTAGYPGGLSSSATFGTISFYAKKTGNAIIKLGSGSLALDANNQNVLSGAPEVSVTILAPTSIPSTTESPTTEPATQPATEQPTAEQSPVTQSEPVSQIPLTATLVNVITLGTGNIWLGILVGLIILAIIIYIAYLLKKKKNLGQL